jgi:uncharacterized protein (TIGR02001 family)
MPPRPLLFVLPIALMLASPATAKVTGLVSLLSDGTTRGIDQTDGRGQFNVQADINKGIFFVGTRQFNLRNALNGRWESQYYTGVRATHGDLSYSLLLNYKYIWRMDKGSDHDFWETEGMVSRRFGPNRLWLRGVFTPDITGPQRTATFLETGLSRDITPAVTLSGSLGRRQVRGNPDYTAWNYGGTWHARPEIDLDLRLYDTANHDYGARYRTRLVGSVIRKF